MVVSEIYGKKIESTNGKKGYVISVNANAGVLVCFICADENEKEFAVDVKNVICIGEKIIYEDRENVIKSSTPLRLGRAGFDEQGKYLGVLEEYTFKNNKLSRIKIGKKNYPAEGVVCGDVVIVKGAKRLKYDVVKDGKVIIKKGTRVTDGLLKNAEKQGEYIQTNLKSI